MTSMSDLIDKRAKTGTSISSLSEAATGSRAYSFTPTEASEPYLDLIGKTESTYGLPKNLLSNLIYHESRFNPAAKSEAGAIGIAQIMPRYHPDIDPTDPEASIDYAGKHLRDLYKQFGNWDMAIAAYNAGAKTVKRHWGTDKLPEETQEYLRRINAAATGNVLGESGVSSMADLIDQRAEQVLPEQKSAVPEIPEPPGIKMEKAENEAIRNYYSNTVVSSIATWTPSLAMWSAAEGFGPQPPGGIDEWGRPLDENGQPYVDEKLVNPSVVSEVLTETLGTLTGFATQPMEVVRGVADFFLSLPAFGVGMIGAAAYSGREMIDQLASINEGDLQGPQTTMEHLKSQALPGYDVIKILNMEEIYNAAAKGMQESFEWFEPGKRALIGEPTEVSAKVGESAMAPLTVLSYLGNRTSDHPAFKDSPNVRGFLRFAGDAVGLITMGVLLRPIHGKGKQEFVKNTEEITTTAADIASRMDEARKAMEQGDLSKTVELKTLEIQKKRLEYKAKQYAEKFNDDLLMAEESMRQAENVAKENMRPVAETGLKKPSTESVVKEAAKELGYGIRYDFTQPQPEGMPPWHGYSFTEGPAKGGSFTVIKEGVVTVQEIVAAGREILKQRKPKGTAEPTKPSKPSTPKKAKTVNDSISAEEIGELRDIGFSDKQISELSPEQAARLIQLDKKWKSRDSVVTDVDVETGAEKPNMDSAFATGIKKTEALRKAFASRDVSKMSVETQVQKLINDANRWRLGDDTINIEAVRNKLSEIASQADQWRGDFISGVDHYRFKETVSAAADWARGLERVESGARLNVMIPLDGLPDAVKNFFRKEFPGQNRIRMSKVYRNVKLFIETGMWFGRDRKWRYEVDDSKAKFDVSKGDTVGEVLDYPTLYKLFPELKNFPFQVIPDLGAFGRFIPGEAILLNSSLKPSMMKDVLLHEIQHYINTGRGAFEGSTVSRESAKVLSKRLRAIAKDLAPTKDQWVQKGLINYANELQRGTRSDFFEVILPFIEKNYKRLGLTEENIKALRFPTGAKSIYKTVPGEMEARLTSWRSELSAKERRSRPPWEDLDAMLTEEGINALSHGTKLYSGAGVQKGAEALVRGAQKVSDYMKKVREEKKFSRKEGFKKIKEELVRGGVERSGNIRKEFLKNLDERGKRIIQKFYLTKGASSISAMFLKQMKKEVYGGLTWVERQVLDNVILSDRMIDIASYKDEKQFKPPGGLKAEDFVTYREVFGNIEKLTAEQVRRIDKRAKAYFNWMKKPLQDMLDAGLISKGEYEDLASHNYRRIEQVVNIFDNKYRAKIGGKKVTVYDSGIEALQRGRETDIYEPSSEIMALETFNRAYGRILRNAANAELLDLARADKNNPYARIKQKDVKIPAEWSRIYVYEGGQRKAIYLSPEVAREWIVNSPEISYKMGQLLRYASGSPVLRTFATGINWGFALANLPRDVMHTWFAAGTFQGGKLKPTYSTFAPKFALEIGRDLSTVFGDAFRRKGRYISYLSEGGGMEFLVHQGRMFQRGRYIGGPLDPFYKFMGYFGETSEVMTRLAIRERVIRRKARERGITLEEARNNKEITEEATFAARDYMDFSQGGYVTKVLDNGLPYLNAAVVGTRGIFRAFKDAPAASSLKLAQFASAVVGVYLASKYLNPKTWENLKDEVDMQNNLCIPLGDSFGFEDEQGNVVYPYLKIPLDPSQKFFKVFFEASTDKWLGEEVDVDAVIDALKEQSPAQVTELSPTVSGVLGYLTNRDYWLNEDIWRRTKEPFDWKPPKALTGEKVGGSEEEYIPGRTPQGYIDFGAATGLSPERTRYAVEELITGGTVWSYLVGKGYEEVFGDLPKSKKKQHLAMVLSETPIVKRFIGVTNPYSKHAKKFSEKEQRDMIENFVENQQLDLLVHQYLYEDTATTQDIAKYINQFKDPDTQDRLLERFDWERAIKNLPEKSFWRRMKGLSPRSRAELFAGQLKKSSVEEKRELWRQLGIISAAGGVVTDKMLDELEAIDIDN